MAKPQIDKRAKLFQRYLPIFNDKNWLELGESSDKTFFRINALEYSKGSILSTYDLLASPEVNWISDTLALVPNEIKNKITQSYPRDLGLFFNGSSFIPVLALNPNNGDHILDMCAAPGVKTSLIAQITKDNKIKIRLTANEKDRERFFKLEKLVDMFAEKSSIECVNQDARFLTNDIHYDKILLDAPCSAEGELIKEKNYNHWSSKVINSYTNAQKGLLAKAISLTNPGGEIIYSTCTIAPEENEEVVNWAKQRFDIEIVPIDIPLPPGIEPIAVSGIPSWGIKKYDEQIENTIHIKPDKVYEGFFIARIVKK